METAQETVHLTYCFPHLQSGDSDSLRPGTVMQMLCACPAGDQSWNCQKEECRGDYAM
ncbi:hypothetical protein LEMLEM_LOCUS1625 [Lemmus lemmus]